MRIVLDVVKYLKASGFVIDRPGRGSQFIPPEAPIYFRNDSGEEVPPFACMQCTGTVEYGGQNYVKINKPVDDSGDAGGYLFNGIAPVESGGYGLAHDGPFVRMLTDGSTLIPMLCERSTCRLAVAGRLSTQLPPYQQP